MKFQEVLVIKCITSILLSLLHNLIVFLRNIFSLDSLLTCIVAQRNK